MKTPILIAGALALVACTDLPDYDDPREFDPPTVPCNDLLANGNFDLGAASWTGDAASVIQDDRNVPNMVIVAETPHDFAWLGGVDSATRTIAQNFDVPDQVTMLELDGYLFVAAVTETGPVEDTLNIQLLDAATGSVIQTPLMLTNLDANRGATNVVWKSFQVAMAPGNARRVTLQLQSMNDAANNTNFLFDTLRVRPAGCS
jgi:hypothetical protein